MSSTKEYERTIVVKENVEPRLISSLNRTGRVYWQDDFESYTAAITERWIQTSGTIALDTGHPFRGKSCMKLTTAAGIGATAQASKYLPLPPTFRGGIEFWWQLQNAIADVDNIGFSFAYYDNTNVHQFTLLYLLTSGAGNQKWQYTDASNALTDVPSGAQIVKVAAADYAWHHVKATVDLVNNKYMKLYSDSLSWDLSSLSFQQTGNASAAIAFIGFATQAKTATAINLLIDDVIWTDQEP
jgi:hypothetical protein